MPGRKTVPFPYTDFAPAVLSAVYDSMYAICRSYFYNGDGAQLQEELRKIARQSAPPGWLRDRPNPHIWEGIDISPRSTLADPLPRVSRICLEAFRRAQERPSGEGGPDPKSKVYFLPSPLGILRDVLTVPAKPESSAYGLALARAHLFARFKIHPAHKRLFKGWSSVSVSEIQDIVESFRVYVLHRDNIHLSINKPERMLVAHFLALLGVISLRMGTAGKRRMNTEDAQQACLTFLKAKEFLNVSTVLCENYEFRLAGGYDDLPDSQEIVNGLMGIPVPIRGASTVFFGGLMRSHTNSVVISVSGAPGTGKTSFALALASTLAPYGTECVYFTFEEDAETLRRRVASLIPDYFRRSTLPNASSLEWFSPFELDAPQTGSIGSFAERYLGVFENGLRARSNLPEISSGELPAIAPLLVVIDSITVLSVGEHVVGELCSFVKRLRELGCVVIILSPDEIPRSSRLDYLVDTVVCLRHEGTESAETKPSRLFQLLKTRLQLSRPGAHILHLSGEEGVRISPQLPSQIDARKIHKVPLPDTHRIVDSFYVERPRFKRDQQHSRRLIDIYKGSRVLIHGHGSAGKAPLGLKILMAPIVTKDRTRPALFPDISLRSRILVTSFLYPEQYYQQHRASLSKQFRRTVKDYKTPDLTGLVLPPGFLRGEDLVARLLRELDKGVLEGRPYTGVLLDGLHNVFLQFPLLQKSDMSWPALYNLLVRFELTVITTFTTFNIDSSGRRDLQDADIVLTGQRPLLHALVQGADFYIRVEPRDLNLHERRFKVIVRSAINQRIPMDALVWNAEELIFDAVEGLSSEELGLYP